MMGMEPGSTQELDEISCSCLMEIGNILASAYLVAIGSMTGLNLLSCPPALAVDMTGAILSSIATAFAENEDTALTVLTRIGDVGTVLEGFFLLTAGGKETARGTASPAAAAKTVDAARMAHALEAAPVLLSVRRLFY